MSDINVLSLHRMGDPRYRREAVRALEYMIPECKPELNCIVHDADLPFPDYLKDLEFDLIVLGPTFLCSRFQASLLNKTHKLYKFVKESPACKVALPQDDYNCSETLDIWMTEWDVNRIYTVIDDNWNVLYPKSLGCREIKLGYTGYISQEWIDAWAAVRSHESRKIDVSYRASRLLASFGRLGQLKWEIADRFKQAANAKSKLKLDISVDPKDMIPGSKWHAFLENSKFCLTTPSGSSLLDPRGEIRENVNAFVARNPDASFDQIEKACFPGLDERFTFSALSPRNLEAGLSGTVQLGTPGAYSGIMTPGIHYIPLEPDCSNIDEVIAMMTDLHFVSQLSSNCREAVLSEPRLRRTAIVDEIIEFAKSSSFHKARSAKCQAHIEASIDRYKREAPGISRRVWRHRHAIHGARRLARGLGLLPR